MGHPSVRTTIRFNSELHESAFFTRCDPAIPIGWMPRFRRMINPISISPVSGTSRGRCAFSPGAELRIPENSTFPWCAFGMVRLNMLYRLILARGGRHGDASPRQRLDKLMNWLSLAGQAL